MKYQFAVFLAVQVWMRLASAQAPGDHDESCREGMNAVNHMFPAEWRILMDTYDYRNLYNEFQIGREPPVWIASDGDGDGRNWDTNFANPCTFLLSTCTGDLSQDNWLYSQHISYNGAREVFFDVTYRFTQCREPACNRRYVTLYHYVRDSVANSERTNSVNYQPLLGDAISSRLEQPTGTSTSITETHAIPRPTNRLGFYLGVQDEGTCGTVDRINVYYVVCPSSVDGLVTYPETGVPVRSGPNVIFDAQCAPNAHNTTTLQVTAFASSSTCSPIAPGGARCECDAGYVISADGLSCEACPAGTYRPFTGTSCRNCPSNTVTDVEAAPQCDCITGFFRSSGSFTSPREGPNTGCTEPPSACTNLQVVARTDTTITVSWSRPTTTGRSDYFYRIHHSDPDNIGVFILERDNLVNGGSTVTYTITGLVPFNSYIIRVTTHNGVSEEDLDNANSRMCEVTTKTRQGVSGPPSNVQGLCTVVVWRAPTQPNGEIIGYDIQFAVPGQQLREVSAAGDTFVITETAERTPGTTVRVRAVNSAGTAGAWTAFQGVGCESEGCRECAALHFELGGTTYLNNTVVVVDDIGEGDNALLCVTNNQDCCSTSREGEFRFPDGSLVPTSGAGQDFYRNRGNQLIRLNRRNGATSPIGRYRCEIPNNSGVLQSIFINTVQRSGLTTCPTQPPTTTCPPVPTCPTAPPPTQCPPVTCPTTEPAPTTTQCPVMTCPPTPMPTECPVPTCPPNPTPAPNSLHFELGGTTYLNNSVVMVGDIGEGENALLCVTDNQECCNNRQGEFRFPDGSLVPTSIAGQDFYRNRNSQIIRLNRRNDATSPVGRYRCEIPDASGVLQYLFIFIAPTDDTPCPPCPPTQAPGTCPTCPEVTCPTTRPPPTECPVVTCPATRPPPTECPVVTCPTTRPAPTCPTTVPGLHFELGGTTYLNNTVVVVDDIGEGDNALFCVTNNQDCCSTSRQGEFQYPDGSLVPISSVGEDFYRSRDSQFIRLNRRNGAISPLGRYHCTIPDISGNMQSLFINIVSSTTDGIVPCPTLPTALPCPTCADCTACPPTTSSTPCPVCLACPTIPTVSCQIGRYLVTTSNGSSVCTSCPANSISISANSRECMCIQGYYRSQMEDVHAGCTRPPSACRNLQVVDSRTRANTITVMWERPLITGRNDYYYNILYSNPDLPGSFIQHNINPLVTASPVVRYSLSGLRPRTRYTIRLSVLNGVSEQDSVGEEGRRSEVLAITGDINPQAPRSVTSFCAVIVWQAPFRAYGTIVGYDVMFTNVENGEEGIVITKDRDVLFHRVEERNLPDGDGGVLIQVRAKTDFADGIWSAPIPLNCSSPTPPNSLP